MIIASLTDLKQAGCNAGGCPQEAESPFLSFDFNKCLQPHQACNKKRVRFGHNAPSSANPAGQLFHMSAVQTSDLPAELLLMLMLIRLC